MFYIEIEQAPNYWHFDPCDVQYLEDSRDFKSRRNPTISQHCLYINRHLSYFISLPSFKTSYFLSLLKFRTCRLYEHVKRDVSWFIVLFSTSRWFASLPADSLGLYLCSELLAVHSISTLSLCLAQSILRSIWTEHSAEETWQRKAVWWSRELEMLSYVALDMTYVLHL